MNIIIIFLLYNNFNLTAIVFFILFYHIFIIISMVDSRKSFLYHNKHV